MHRKSLEAAKSLHGEEVNSGELSLSSGNSDNNTKNVTPELRSPHLKNDDSDDNSTIIVQQDRKDQNCINVNDDYINPKQRTDLSIDDVTRKEKKLIATDVIQKSVRSKEEEEYSSDEDSSLNDTSLSFSKANTQEQLQHNAGTDDFRYAFHLY